MAYKQSGWSPFTKKEDKKKKLKKKQTEDLYEPSDTVRVSNKYKVGDWVSEEDLEGAFSRKGSDPKNYPQYSVEDYSKVKKDKKGNYVLGLRRKKKKK